MVLQTIEKFNKAFDRKDFEFYCSKKRQNDNIFDKIIKDYIRKDGNKFAIHITNDPEKMIGCGFRIRSSYSPESVSFQYLPSFVLQDYIGMLYITDGTTIKKKINGVEFEAPNYLARMFVMINPDTHYILCKMPCYTDQKDLYDVFNTIKEKGFGVIKSNTYPPEIHLDCLELFYADLTQGYRPQTHIAVCGVQYPCMEYEYNRKLLKGKWDDYLF